MKNLFFSVIALVISFCSFAQEGWNWPENPELKSKALEMQAYYKILIAQSKHEEALNTLRWLYENNPNLHQSIYIEGADCLQEVMKNADKERQSRLQDSVLWMYDQRIKYFDNDANVLDRKAYQAFQYYFKEPSRFKELIEMYEVAYEKNGAEIMTSNLSPYMYLAKLAYQNTPGIMPAEKVIDIHSTITEIIDTKRKNGESGTKLDREQDKTDAYLSSIDGILSCSFIEERLVPKYRANPNDLSIAKKIFKYSVDAKCTNEPYFLEASIPVYKEAPSFTLAKAIGAKYLSVGSPQTALTYYQEAQNLATTNEDKYEALIGLATAHSKLGNKTKSRALAYEALNLKPGSAEAYNTIGNLYFTSFDECKEGKSKVLDRGVFLVAYKMYERAGNASQMQASKDQFPSIEEIFSEGYQEGQSISVGCWINEAVELKRRD